MLLLVVPHLFWAAESGPKLAGDLGTPGTPRWPWPAHPAAVCRGHVVVNEGAAPLPTNVTLPDVSPGALPLRTSSSLFAEVQLCLLRTMHLVGAEVCAHLQVSWKLVKGLHFKRDTVSIESDNVRCCASVCVGVPAHPVVSVVGAKSPGTMSSTSSRSSGPSTCSQTLWRRTISFTITL